MDFACTVPIRRVRARGVVFLFVRSQDKQQYSVVLGAFRRGSFVLLDNDYIFLLPMRELQYSVAGGLSTGGERSRKKDAEGR